jgi:cytochrome c-type biogenesis protein CcmH/NrfF
MRFLPSAFLLLSLLLFPLTGADASRIMLEKMTAMLAFKGEDEVDDTSFKGITSSIFCPCGCDRMLVSDCNCKVADEIKGFIKGRIDEGAGKEEIIGELKARYGERIIPISPERGFGLAAWIASILAFLIGTSIVALALKTWVSGKKEGAVETPPKGIERYRDRIERELEKYR